ncbi:MAG: hypothetical protein L0214_07540 [candidate division NC10 bacterium]|nr:hypothetical protein [candidate division NC10 bacterium]
MKKKTIPGEALEIRYRRGGAQAGKYFHPFGPGVKMYANADGSVTLRGQRRIHAEDSEPGFWERYGHRGGRSTMANPWGTNMTRLMQYLLVGGAVYFLLLRPRSAFALPTTGLPGQGQGQEPIRYWFDPTTSTVVEAWGVEAPGPTFRPASTYEVEAFGVAVGGGM